MRAFELRVFSCLLLSSQGIKDVTPLFLPWEFGCKLLSRCPLFANMAPSPDRVTPQSCHIRNSWRTPKNVIATDSHGLLKCIASSHRLSSMGLQMHFDGNLRLLDQRCSR